MKIPTANVKKEPTRAEIIYKYEERIHKLEQEIKKAKKEKKVIFEDIEGEDIGLLDSHSRPIIQRWKVEKIKKKHLT